MKLPHRKNSFRTPIQKISRANKHNQSVQLRQTLISILKLTTLILHIPKWKSSSMRVPPLWNKQESDGYYQQKRKKSGHPSVIREAARNHNSQKPSVQIRWHLTPESMGPQTTGQTRKRRGGRNRLTTIVQE